MERKIEWVDNTFYDDDDDEFELDDEEEDDFSEKESVKLPNLRKMIIGPFGAFEVSNFLSPYKDHLIFTGHTNFILTKDIVRKIDACDGVDALRVPSKYTFHISVGLGFDIEEVLSNVEIALGVVGTFKDDTNDNDNGDLQKIVTDLVKELSSHKLWAFYIMPNGEHEFTFVDSDDEKEIEDFKKQVEIYKECRKISNGIFFSNETNNNK